MRALLAEGLDPRLRSLLGKVSRILAEDINPGYDNKVRIVKMESFWGQ